MSWEHEQQNFSKNVKLVLQYGVYVWRGISENFYN